MGHIRSNSSLLFHFWEIHLHCSSGKGISHHATISSLSLGRRGRRRCHHFAQHKMPLSQAPVLHPYFIPFKKFFQREVPDTRHCCIVRFLPRHLCHRDGKRLKCSGCRRDSRPHGHPNMSCACEYPSDRGQFLNSRSASATSPPAVHLIRSFLQFLTAASASPLDRGLYRLGQQLNPGAAGV